MPHKDPEERKAYQDHYRETHRDEKRATANAHYYAHLDEVSAYWKAHYQTNSDEKKAKTRAYQKAHPLETKWKKINAKAKKRGCKERITFDEFKAMVDATCGVCPCCKKPFSGKRHAMSLDHVIPIGCGGENTAANAQIICWLCNTKKGCKTIRY